MCKIGKLFKSLKLKKFDYKYFLSVFLLWLTSVVLNLLPIVLDLVKLLLESDVLLDFWSFFWGSKDLICLNFTISFLLFVELVFFCQESPSMGSISFFRVLFFLISFVCMITYLIALFSPKWNEKVPLNVLISINRITFLSVLGVGTLYFIFLSSVRSKRKGA